MKRQITDPISENLTDSDLESMIGSGKVFPPIAMKDKTSFVTISLLPIDF